MILIGHVKNNERAPRGGGDGAARARPRDPWRRPAVPGCTAYCLSWCWQEPRRVTRPLQLLIKLALALALTLTALLLLALALPTRQ